VRKLIDGTSFPHVRLALILLYTTAARSSALCSLTWERCDFDRERIDLRDPTITRAHKGRAIAPMLRTAKAALLEAKQCALTPYVIEWGGEPVKSLKRGIKTAAKAARITGKRVSPHILRHSAAVHMAEDEVSMEKIQQFLGHSDINTTRAIYARFSPSYLKDAAAALELDDLGSLNHRALRKT
jgi:integrase